MSNTSKGWPPKRRAAQARRIRQAKPWKHSTGPKTRSGKARSAQNAATHGMTGAVADALRDALRDLRSAMRLTMDTDPV